MDLPQDVAITPTDANHLIDPATIICQDILYDIFLYLKPPTSEIHWTSSHLAPQQPILRLGHVSKAWRSLVWSFPLLWDCLELPFSRVTPIPVIEEILGQFLGRSGDSPLHISLHVRTLWSDVIVLGSTARSVRRWETILNTLLKHSHRWHTLKFIGPGGLLRDLNEGNHDLPLLTTACCKSSGDRDGETPRLSFLNKAPSLRNLRLFNCDDEDNQIFPNLTRLRSAGESPRSMELLLAVANKLQHLELSASPRLGLQLYISLPRLSVMRLFQGDQGSLPKRFDTPMLRCLTVATLRATHLSQVFQCIQNSLSTSQLHTLGISSSLIQSDILYQVLSITDSLSTFYLYQAGDIGLRWCTLAEVLNPDQPLKVKGSGKKPKVILPNLENLYYRTDVPVRTTDLVEMIKRRWNGYQSAQEYDGSGRLEWGWKRIRTVHLTRTDLAGFDLTDRLQAEILEGLEVHYDLPLGRESTLGGLDGYDCILPRHRGV